jgi:hypothetical protein
MTPKGDGGPAQHGAIAHAGKDNSDAVTTLRNRPMLEGAMESPRRLRVFTIRSIYLYRNNWSFRATLVSCFFRQSVHTLPGNVWRDVFFRAVFHNFGVDRLLWVPTIAMGTMSTWHAA